MSLQRLNQLMEEAGAEEADKFAGKIGVVTKDEGDFKKEDLIAISTPEQDGVVTATKITDGAVKGDLSVDSFEVKGDLKVGNAEVVDDTIVIPIGDADDKLTFTLSPNEETLDADEVADIFNSERALGIANAFDAIADLVVAADEPPPADDDEPPPADDDEPPPADDDEPPPADDDEPRNKGESIERILKRLEANEALEISDAAEKDGVVQVKISGKDYSYTPMPGENPLTATTLVDKFNRIKKHSAFSALSWLKKNAVPRESYRGGVLVKAPKPV